MEPQKVVKIALDSSSLLAVEQFKQDIFEAAKIKFGNVEFYIPKTIMEELDRLAAGNKTQKKRVNIAKQLLKLHNTSEIETKSQIPDLSLIELGKQGFIVATYDREIRKQLKGFGGKIFYLSSNKLTTSLE